MLSHISISIRRKERERDKNTRELHLNYTRLQWRKVFQLNGAIHQRDNSSINPPRIYIYIHLDPWNELVVNWSRYILDVVLSRRRLLFNDCSRAKNRELSRSDPIKIIRARLFPVANPPRRARFTRERIACLHLRTSIMHALVKFLLAGVIN